MARGSTLARTVTMPIRLGLAAGELGLEVALGIVRGTRRALEPDQRPRRGRPVPSPLPTEHPPPRRPSPAARSTNGAATTPVPPPTATGDSIPVRPPPPGAKLVDDTPVPVGEFGGEGADEAAGAEVRVAPPWDGYDGLTAAQVQRRLADADREVVAAVLLYESTRRDRRSVVRAADRRLRALSA
jgi:hypothetical protein